MGWFDGIKKTEKVEIISKEDDWTMKKIGNIRVPETFKNSNAFILANSIPEINFPIDFIADRISKLRFFIADKKGNELLNTELTRLITDINPLYSFTDLVYQYVYSLLADGNVRNYIQVPSLYKNISPENISRWDIINPQLLKLEEYDTISLLATNRQELIKSAEYSEFGKKINLEVDKLFIHNYNLNKRSHVLSISPLMSANYSIDILLAVYSARYNVYANNGAAGYLAKKSSVREGDLESALSDQSKRDEILKDINDRHGLTGAKNLWGISGVPIEFVKTLATISELMPLDETLEAAIKIASVFQIPSELVPRKDHSTFSNQEDAEVAVWENCIFSMTETVCSNLTKLFAIEKYGKFKSDYSSVSCLNKNKSLKEDYLTKKLDNLTKLKALSPDVDLTNEITKIVENYGQE